jgi:hypothetical protein
MDGDGYSNADDSDTGSFGSCASSPLGSFSADCLHVLPCPVDGDGIPNAEDEDIDNDGILNENDPDAGLFFCLPPCLFLHV